MNTETKLKAEDLMIRNWILATKTNGNPNGWTEIEIHSGHITTCEIHPEWFKPIPLSEVWLAAEIDGKPNGHINAGFKYDKKREIWKLGNIELSYITTDKVFQYEIRFPYGDWFVQDVPFVHNLQQICHIFKQPITFKISE